MKISRTRFWLLYHAGMLLFSMVATIVTQYLNSQEIVNPQSLVPFVVTLLTSVFVGYLAIYLVKRAEKLSHAQVMKSIVPGFLLFLLLSFIIANLAVTIGLLGWYLASGINLNGFMEQLFKHELVYANGRLAVWFMFFSIAFFYILWRKSAQKEQQLREEMLKFQYQTLKSQVNPHFLFNSLNTLSELVYEKPELADNYIQELSRIYRYILENEENRLIPLQEEIAFVQQYFKLRQARDQEKIKLKIELPTMNKMQIVPVSLQLLVENALKHNSYSVKSPLEINIGQQNGHIIVSNNIQRKSTLEPSTGKGLKNLRQRVKLIMDQEIIIEETDEQYTVHIPVISKEL